MFLQILTTDTQPPALPWGLLLNQNRYSESHTYIAGMLASTPATHQYNIHPYFTPATHQYNIHPYLSIMQGVTHVPGFFEGFSEH